MTTLGLKYKFSEYYSQSGTQLVVCAASAEKHTVELLAHYTTVQQRFITQQSWWLDLSVAPDLMSSI